MSRVKRHDWEDAIIEAGAQGLIKPGAVNVCLRLAKAITWCPQGQKSGWPSGLYWKNGLALKSVGSSTSSWSEYRQSLFDAGFFIEDKGQNLIPQIPDLSEIRTTEEEATVRDSEGLSEIRNEVSEIRNEVSEIDHPYSVLSSGLSSVDTSSVSSVADAPEAANLDSHEPEDTSDSDTSSEPTIYEPSNEGSDDSTISEPLTHLGPTTTGPVGNADVRDVETCESSSTPEAAAAKLDYGSMAKNRLEAAIERLRFSTIDEHRKNLLNYSPENRKTIVLRAGKPEFYHLKSAEERIEAAFTAILAERSTK